MNPDPLRRIHRKVLEGKLQVMVEKALGTFYPDGGIPTTSADIPLAHFALTRVFGTYLTHPEGEKHKVFDRLITAVDGRCKRFIDNELLPEINAFAEEEDERKGIVRDLYLFIAAQLAHSYIEQSQPAS